MVRKSPFIIISVVSIFMFALSQLVFDFNLGTVFAILSLANLVMYLVMRTPNFPDILVEKVVNRTKTASLAAIGYLVTILITMVAVGIYTKVPFSLTSVIEIIKEQQALVLSESALLQYSYFGVLIPNTETIAFFGALFVFSLWIFGQRLENLKLGKLNWLGYGFFLSAVFIFFHFQSKGITNIPALIAVGAFGLVSVALVVIEKQLAAAILLHIINNSVAVALDRGLVVGVTQFFMFAGAVVIIYLILIKLFKIPQIGR